MKFQNEVKKSDVRYCCSKYMRKIWRRKKEDRGEGEIDYHYRKDLAAFLKRKDT
jgi:hypothetical protein